MEIILQNLDDFLKGDYPVWLKNLVSEETFKPSLSSLKPRKILADSIKGGTIIIKLSDLEGYGYVGSLDGAAFQFNKMFIDLQMPFSAEVSTVWPENGVEIDVVCIYRRS